jgi:hypothetical protein
MSLIEGVGDEVTFLVAVIIIFIVIVVAWMSTRVDAMPYTSIVIIDRDRFVELLRRLRGLSASTSSAAASTVAGGGTATVSSNTASSNVNENEVTVPNSEIASGMPNVRPADAAEHAETQESELNAGVYASAPSLGHEQPADFDSGASSSCSQSNDSCSPSNKGVITDKSNDETDTSTQQLSDQQAPSVVEELTAGQVQIRLQYIDGRQKLVLANPDDTIGHLKRFELTIYIS